MALLAIDYGKSKVGFAISSGNLAVPLTVYKYSSYDDLFSTIDDIVDQEGVKKIVVGISSGKFAFETKVFAKRLEEEIGKVVVFQDETLTTKDAQRLSMEAGIKQKKRRQKEDAFAAALILQSYIDENS